MSSNSVRADAAASTFNGTTEHPSSNVQVPVQTPEAPTSLDELLRSPHNPAYRNGSSEPINGASPYDERRRNGFHLWRTESEDAKTARLRRVVEEAQAREANTWSLQNSLPDACQRFARRCKAALRLSIYREAKPEEGSEAPAAIRLPLSSTKLTTVGLIALTISLAGAQLAWTLELAYGTPYLLSLGLSEQSTSLVWLAGPLSGLLAQPVVGSLSDTSSSLYRRRMYMAVSAALLTLSTITLAYSVPISIAIVDFTGGGLADWDPKRNELVQWTTQVVSITAFWILDFALNGLQAASRALILDIAPSEQQSVANAWHGRMTHTGNVVGYLCGWLDLASWQGLSWLGGGQFRRFALVSILGMLTCVSITIASIQEKQTDSPGHNARPKSWFGSALWQQTKETTHNVWHAIRRLPRPVRRICLVQMFAFMGWFPFLFYGTTYVLQTAEYQRKLKNEDHIILFAGDKSKSGEPSSDHDAERGSFAMLLFALVALTFGALLPYISLAGEKRRKSNQGSIKLPNDDQEFSASNQDLHIDTAGDPESSPLLAYGNEPKLSFARRVFRGLREGLTLRTFWTLASLFFAALMLLGTVWAQTVHQVTILIALVGLPWSVAAWAPFAMVGEFVREAETGASPFEFDSDHWSPTQTRARTKALKDRALRKARRESIRSFAAAPTDDVASAPPSANADTASVSSKKSRGAVAIRYINPQSSPHARRLSESHGSPIRTPTRTSFGTFSGEEGARDRLRSSLVDCAPLPKNLSSPTRSSQRHYLDRSSVLHNAVDEESDNDYDDDLEEYEERDEFEDRQQTGGGGTILGIHNLAIVTPQFIVAIISSLIFKALDPSSHQTDGIHLVLGQSPLLTTHVSVSKHAHDRLNPAEGTIWVLRFGGLMALFAALCTRFVPLTLSERKKRFLYNNGPAPEPLNDDLDANSES